LHREITTSGVPLHAPVAAADALLLRFFRNGRVAAAPASTFSALRHRNFCWLWAGTFFSTGGQWIQQATLGWVVYDLTGSGTLLGAVLAMRAVPMLLLAPVSGLVADRFDRRFALAVSQMLVVVLSFGLAALLALNRVEIWHLFAFTLLAGVGMVFDRTLRNTLVFGVVPRNEVANAVALNTIAFSVMRAIGPAFAGVMIGSMGPAWNFAIQGVLYCGVAGSVLMISGSHRPVRTAARASAWADMKEGLHFAVTDPVARMMVMLGLVPPLLLIPSFSALMPVFAVRVFDVGPEGLGLLLAAVGGGGVLGGFLATVTARYERVGAVQVAALVVFALSLVGFALSPNMAIAIVFLIAAGTAEMVHAASNVTTLQMCAPQALRGRIASLIPVFPAFIAAGSFTSGVGADLIGVQPLVILLALAGTGFAGIAWARSTALRRLRLSGLVAGAE
jgi:MFS family permease